MMQLDHSPSLIGYQREVAEYVADSARFFGWAYGKYRAHDNFFQIGAAIDQRLAAWQPPSPGSIH
jgi:hypothetical protein